MTTTTPHDNRPMVDRADTETVLYRVAICAFTYYSGKPWDEPGYTLDDDVTWCTAPLAALPPLALTELKTTVRTLIADPTADRRGFITALAELAES